MRSLPPPSALARHWDLDPEVVFLNHGSFGACPRDVLAYQHELQRTLERQPMRFLARESEQRLDDARASLATFLNCDADDLAFVPNATSGVNTVLRSLAFEPGDELLTTDHAYNACRNALDFVAERSGARVVVSKVPFPITDAEPVVQDLLAKATERTRLCLLDHVTSPTALVLPAERIVRELDARGIDTLVDGAHVPGMLPLDLTTLGAAYYTGNFHKWLCAPKGAAFLHVRRDRQAAIRPLTISHGANSSRSDRSRFRIEFDWTGTSDITPYLCVARAHDFLSQLFPDGFTGVRRRNHELTLRARDTLCAALDVPPPAPDDMLGSMAAFPLPATSEPTVGPFGFDPLHIRLLEQHSIETVVQQWPHPQVRLLRISPQLYNSIEQYEYLAAALVELL